MTKQLPRIDAKSNQLNLLSLIIFGAAFGFIEAATVYYLRGLLNFHTGYIINNYHTLLNLGFITFVSPIHTLLINNRISTIEIIREMATIILLLAVAFIAGRNRRQRLGAFLVSFACWDIAYYVFLKLIDNWPGNLLAKDVYFLIPVTWIGPVLTPLIISTVMLAIGIRIYRQQPVKPNFS
jgi:hypothetical protein